MVARLCLWLVNSFVVFSLVVVPLSIHALTFDEQHCQRGSVPACESACDDGSAWACDMLDNERFTTENISGIKGDWLCPMDHHTPKDKNSYRSATQKASKACEALDFSKDWFVDDITVVNRVTKASGKCADNKRLVQYTVNARCKLYY